MTTFVVCRSQAIFDASVVPDGLPAIDIRWIDQFILPADGPGTFILNSYLGRGPLSHALEPSAMLFFDHGEETYPVFGVPSEGPKGAALRGATIGDHITVDESSSAFVVNVTVTKTVALGNWEAAANNQLDVALISGIQATLRDTKAVLDTIVGTMRFTSIRSYGSDFMSAIHTRSSTPRRVLPPARFDRFKRTTSFRSG